MTEPTWVSEDGRVTLYRGDCLDVLPTLPAQSFDVVIADPPFNAGKEYHDGFDDSKTLEEYRAWLNSRLFALGAAMKNGGSLWLMQDQKHIGFCMVELEKLGLEFQNLVAWAYTNPTPATKHFPKTWRPIMFYSNGTPAHFDWRADEMTKPTLYHNPDRAKRHNPHDLWSDIPKLVGGFLAPKELVLDQNGRFAHLAQMPVRLADRIIRVNTCPDDTVLDPFMGSGTTGVACVQTGRRFIGIELSESYFDIAKRRIIAAQQQLSLLGEAQA